jgi:hypothetical protein
MQRPKKSPLAKLLALTLTFAMLLGIAITAAAAPAYPDISGHWGETAIEKWSAYDVLHGNDLGTFEPDGELDVTQLAQILVNTFGYTESYSGALPGYSSVWGEEAVRKAVAAGAIEASEAALPLTRELAAKIVAKAFGIAPISGASKFSDDYAISAEYRPYAAALGRAGIFNGNDYGEFMPSSVFSRAQIMQALDNAVTDIVKEGKAAESAKSVIISKGGVTLTEGTINGDLIIAQGVGDGDITLDGVTVKGRLVIFGGGLNSIHIKGKSNIPRVTVAKTFGQAARFVVESVDATVGTVTVVAESKATVATTNGAEIAKIEVAPVTEVSATGEVAAAAVTATTTVIISAKAAAVEIAAENAALTISSGAAITSLTVETKATVSVASGATVTAATIEASDVKLSGAGKVTAVTVTEDAKTGVEVKTSGTKVTVDTGAGSVTTSTGKVDAGKSSTTSNPTTNSGSDIVGGGTGQTTTTVTIESQEYTFDSTTKAFSGVTISYSVTNSVGDTTATVNAEDYAVAVDSAKNTVTVTKDEDATPTAPTAAGTEITVKITNNSVSKTTTFILVDEKLVVESEKSFVVVTAKENGSIAQLKAATAATGGAFTIDGTAKWYYIETTAYAGYFSTINAQNNGSYNDLFVLTLGGATEKLTLTGDPEVGIKDINVGIANQPNTLPDVTIPFKGFGTSTNSYTGVKIHVNDGVYLDIATTLDTNGTQTGYLGSANNENGSFTNGTLVVASGAKVRDSAWYGVPLGSNSAIVVENGGYLAVGVGTKDGVSSNTGYSGWLIGPDTSAKIQLSISGAEPGGDTFIEVFSSNNNVVLSGKATVNGPTNLFYNICMTAGSIIEITDTGELDSTVAKEHSLSQPHIYGIVGTDAAVGNTLISGTESSKIVIKSGGKISKGYLESSDTATDNSIAFYTASSDTTITASTDGTVVSATAVRKPYTDNTEFGYKWTATPVIWTP